MKNFEVSRHQINTILLPYSWGWLKTLWKTCHGPLRPKKTQKKALYKEHALMKSPAFKIIITVLLLRHFINRFNHPILSICSLSPGDGYTGLFCLTDSIKTTVSLICSCHTKPKASSAVNLKSLSELNHVFGSKTRASGWRWHSVIVNR